MEDTVAADGQLGVAVAVKRAVGVVVNVAVGVAALIDMEGLSMVTDTLAVTDTELSMDALIVGVLLGVTVTD